MKNVFLLVFILNVCFSARAQSYLEVKGYFGISAANVATKVDLDGAGSVKTKNFKEFGLILSKDIVESFSLNAGLNFAFGEVVELNWPTFNRDFEMISIPVYAEYGLGEYLYVAAGPIVDFQLSAGNNFSDQSGFGYLIGIGGQVESGKLSFSIFPNYKRHSVIPFEKSENYKEILQELGLQFGVGYQFLYTLNESLCL